MDKIYKGRIGGEIKNSVPYAVNPDELTPLAQVEGLVNGERIDEVWNGAEDLDWNEAVHVVEIQGATTLSDLNLPTGTGTKVIELLVSGDFALELPAYWTPRPSNDSYVGTGENHIVVSCMNGNAGEEIVIYSLENLA